MRWPMLCLFSGVVAIHSSQRRFRSVGWYFLWLKSLLSYMCDLMAWSLMAWSHCSVSSFSCCSYSSPVWILKTFRRNRGICKFASSGHGFPSRNFHSFCAVTFHVRVTVVQLCGTTCEVICCAGIGPRLNRGAARSFRESSCTVNQSHPVLFHSRVVGTQWQEPFRKGTSWPVMFSLLRFCLAFATGQFNSVLVIRFKVQVSQDDGDCQILLSQSERA